jgi:uncharacterized integral membrane protein
MMKSQLLLIFLILIAFICGASANLFFKKASSQILEVPVYQNTSLFVGLSLFTLVLILFILAFRFGGETTVIYPAYATTYIWVAYLSYKIDGIEISHMQIWGMFFVILGVSLVGMGFKNSP